ncbi:MAG: GCN5-related N-acetyltransferase [Nocardioides sp.]|nr:GCN5-related N-acetyltransferase [Nocardioides sp.]
MVSTGPTDETASVEISRIDPADVDLDLAERLVAIDRASHGHAGLELPVQSGPSRMFSLQRGNNGRPVDAVWVVGPLAEPAGWGLVELPFLDNLDRASLRGILAPVHRRAGLGTALLERLTGFAREHGRTKLSTGAWLGTDGIGFLDARGFGSAGVLRYAVRRLDLHDDPARFDRLYAEAADAARDYELVRLAGPAPDAMVDDLVGLHDAINDAPADEGTEPDAWDAARVRKYDASMARRHQTTYRVLARHRTSGDWAGMSLLCVDEFAPAIAFQEDTAVVRAHRGHRLGLLMKCEMARWLAAERPEVAATDTWNATDNHHMIAVNERLGCRVVATNVGYRRQL